MREQRVVLEDRVDVAVEGRVRRDVAAAEEDPARGRGLEAGDHPQHGGLAGAGWARASRRTRRRRRRGRPSRPPPPIRRRTRRPCAGRRDGRQAQLRARPRWPCSRTPPRPSDGSHASEGSPVRSADSVAKSSFRVRNRRPEPGFAHIAPVRRLPRKGWRARWAGLTMRPVRLLERDSSLASLREYAEDARGGSGRLVLISGEAGVGKTALLECLEEELPQADWAWGGCDGLSTPRPLGPLFDIAARIDGDLLAACQAAAPRETLFRTLLRQVDGDRAAGRPTVLVIEDAHWADEATLDLVRFLGRRIRDSHVLLVVTYRDDGLRPDDPLRVVLGEVASHRSTRRIGLAPLSASAVRSSPRRAGSRPSWSTSSPPATRSTSPSCCGAAPRARRCRARRTTPSWRGSPSSSPTPAGSSSSPPSPVPGSSRGSSRRSATTRRAGSTPASPPGSWPRTGPGSGSGTRSPGSPWPTPCPVHHRPAMHAALLDCLRQAGSDDDARLAHHAEGAGDPAAVSSTRPGRRVRRRGCPPTARHLRSTSAHCASPRARPLPSSPRCTTGSARRRR